MNQRHDLILVGLIALACQPVGQMCLLRVHQADGQRRIAAQRQVDARQQRGAQVARVFSGVVSQASNAAWPAGVGA